LHGDEDGIRSKKLGRGIVCEANERREWRRQDDPKTSNMQGPESNNLHSKWQKSHLFAAQEPLQPRQAPMENTSTTPQTLLDL
jgi:hypothetical protein